MHPVSDPVTEIENEEAEMITDDPAAAFTGAGYL